MPSNHTRLFRLQSIRCRATGRGKSLHYLRSDRLQSVNADLRAGPNGKAPSEFKRRNHRKTTESFSLSALAIFSGRVLDGQQRHHLAPRPPSLESVKKSGVGEYFRSTCVCDKSRWSPPLGPRLFGALPMAQKADPRATVFPRTLFMRSSVCWCNIGRAYHYRASRPCVSDQV